MQEICTTVHTAAQALLCLQTRMRMSGAKPGVCLRSVGWPRLQGCLVGCQHASHGLHVMVFRRLEAAFKAHFQKPQMTAHTAIQFLRRSAGGLQVLTKDTSLDVSNSQGAFRQQGTEKVHKHLESAEGSLTQDVNQIHN